MNYRELFNLYYSNVIIEENNIDINKEKEFSNYYLNLLDFYKLHNINIFIHDNHVLDPDMMIKTGIVEEEEINSFINYLSNQSLLYKEKKLMLDEYLKPVLDPKYDELGFSGTYPKYYNDNAKLEVNYDYLMIFTNNRISITIYADCVRFVGEEERHFKLYQGKYELGLEEEIYNFINPYKEVKYLEVIDRIIHNNPKLPRWYKLENINPIQLNRFYLWGIFLILAVIVSILVFILFSGRMMYLIIGYVFSFIISKLISMIIVNKVSK